MPDLTQHPTHSAAQMARDMEVADWYIWAARRRIQQASREMDQHRRELLNFEDSFALQLAQMQQHVRRLQQERLEGGPDHAAVVDRVRSMLMLSQMIARASRTLGDLAQMTAQMAAAAYWAGIGYQDPSAN